MSEFHDPELRQQLGRLSGPYPDDNVAFAQWQRRVGHVRRRRAVAWTTGAAMSLVFATVGAAALQNQTRHALVPSNTVESSVDTTNRVTTTEVDDSSTTSILAATTTTMPVESTPSTEVIVDSSAPEPESTDGGATGGDEQASGGTSSGNKHQSGGSPSPAPPPAPTAPPATAVPASTTKNFSSVGGSITVRQDGDRLTITATAVAPGFSVEKGDSKGHEVSVKFTSANHTSQISVKLSDSAMKGHVSERDDPNDGSDHTDPAETDHT
jgi:hypothetical protein